MAREALKLRGSWSEGLGASIPTVRMGPWKLFFGIFENSITSLVPTLMRARARRKSLIVWLRLKGKSFRCGSKS